MSEVSINIVRHNRTNVSKLEIPHNIIVAMKSLRKNDYMDLEVGEDIIKLMIKKFPRYEIAIIGGFAGCSRNIPLHLIGNTFIIMSEAAYVFPENTIFTRCEDRNGKTFYMVDIIPGTFRESVYEHGKLNIRVQKKRPKPLKIAGRLFKKEKLNYMFQPHNSY